MSEQQPSTQAEAPVTESIDSSNEQIDNVENTEANIEENQEQAASNKEASASIKKALKKLSLQVDGKKFEEELPFEIPDDPKAVEYMQRELQLAKMGQKRAQYAAQLEKEVKEFVENLRKDPRKVLSDPTLGVDLKSIAKQIIEEEIENAKKSPEQIEKEKLEAEIKALKEQQEKDKKDRDQKEFERLQELAYEQYDLQMTKALEGSDLPKSPYVVKKMADYLLLGLQNNLDITPEEVLPLVREEIQNDLKEMFQVMPDEVVEKLIGKEKINSLRKKSVAKAKAAPPTPVTKAVKDVGRSSKDEGSKESKKTMTYKDFFKV